MTAAEQAVRPSRPESADLYEAFERRYLELSALAGALGREMDLEGLPDASSFEQLMHLARLLRRTAEESEALLWQWHEARPHEPVR